MNKYFYNYTKQSLKYKQLTLIVAIAQIIDGFVVILTLGNYCSKLILKAVVNKIKKL